MTIVCDRCGKQYDEMLDTEIDYGNATLRVGEQRYNNICQKCSNALRIWIKDNESRIISNSDAAKVKKAIHELVEEIQKIQIEFE